MTKNDSIFSNMYQKPFSSINARDKTHQHSKPVSSHWNSGDVSKFRSSTESLMSDEYYSSCDLMSGETQGRPELLQSMAWKSQQMRSDTVRNIAYIPEQVDYLGVPTLIPSRAGGEMQRNGMPKRFREQFLNDRIPKNRGLFMQRHWNMWSPPPSPIFQSSPSPVEDTYSDLEIVPYPEKVQKRYGREGGSKLVAKAFDESEDGSFLYVTTNNVEQMKDVFRKQGLDIQDIGKTSTPGVLVVLFKTHELAKRAFISQKDIGIRMVPPNVTRRYWLKNPSPKFHVIFETTRRLTVKTGKSNSNARVGDLLMTDARNRRGCFVLADQMKGHRLRVIGYVGKLLLVGGTIVERNCMVEQGFVGWISTRCYKTKEKFILRITKNSLADYVYEARMEAAE